MSLTLELESCRFSLMGSGDLAELDKLLSENLIYGHSNGNWDSKAQYLAGLRSSGTRYADLQFQISKVNLLQGFASVHGAMQATLVGRNGSREISNRYLAIWTLESDSVWRLLAYQPTAFNRTSS